jgi:NADPH:quinone reductase-like Zn-dependent oxidoreductase
MGPILSYFRLGHSNARFAHKDSFFAVGTNAIEAVYYPRHGDASVLTYTDAFARPIPVDGQVEIQVHAASVNPCDVKLRAYSIPTYINPLPKIVGTDFSGIVTNISHCKTTRLHVGDRVFGMMPILYSHW